MSEAKNGGSDEYGNRTFDLVVVGQVTQQARRAQLTLRAEQRNKTYFFSSDWLMTQ